MQVSRAAHEKAMSAIIPRQLLYTMVRGVGVTGFVFTILLIGAALSASFYFQHFALSYITPLYHRPGFPAGARSIASWIVVIASLIPVIPVAMVAVFLPIRIAWINGRVPIGALIDGMAQSFQDVALTLNASWRQLIYLLIPIIAVLALAHQTNSQGRAPQMALLLAVIGIALLAHFIWRSAALLCAGPITILASCHPIAAVAESHLVLRSKYRLQIVLIFLAFAALAVLTFTLQVRSGAQSYLTYAGLALLLFLYWILSLLLGLICIQATIEYIRSNPITRTSA